MCRLRQYGSGYRFREHEKHLHVHAVPRVIPADKMIETLCTLYQKYALVNDMVRERSAQEKNPKPYESKYETEISLERRKTS